MVTTTQRTIGITAVTATVTAVAFALHPGLALIVVLALWVLAVKAADGES